VRTTAVCNTVTVTKKDDHKRHRNSRNAKIEKKTEKSVGDEARYQEGAQRKKEPKGGQSLSDDDDDDDDVRDV
jgi:hypothetical protein